MHENDASGNSLHVGRGGRSTGAGARGPPAAGVVLTFPVPFDHTSPSYKDPFSKPLNRTEPSFTVLQVRERGVSTNQPLLSTHVKNKIEVKIYLHIATNQIGMLIIKTSCCGQKVAKRESFTTGWCL